MQVFLVARALQIQHEAKHLASSTFQLETMLCHLQSVGVQILLQPSDRKVSAQEIAAADSSNLVRVSALGGINGSAPLAPLDPLVPLPLAPLDPLAPLAPNRAESGARGACGASGAIGASGASGARGASGASGASGANGTGRFIFLLLRSQ